MKKSFLIPAIVLYVVRAAFSINVQVGTVLFTTTDLVRKCWSDYDKSLLRARAIMQDVLPDPDCLDFSNPESIVILLDYFHTCYKIISISTYGKVQHLLFVALSDAFGGYLRAHVLPYTRKSYYAGILKYSEAQKIFLLYDDIKSFLKTDGRGWPLPSKAPLRTFQVKPLEITGGTEEDCKILFIIEKEGKEHYMNRNEKHQKSKLHEARPIQNCLSERYLTPFREGKVPRFAGLRRVQRHLHGYNGTAMSIQKYFKHLSPRPEAVNENEGFSSFRFHKRSRRPPARAVQDVSKAGICAGRAHRKEAHKGKLPRQENYKEVRKEEACREEARKEEARKHEDLKEEPLTEEPCAEDLCKTAVHKKEDHKEGFSIEDLFKEDVNKDARKEDGGDEDLYKVEVPKEEPKEIFNIEDLFKDEIRKEEGQKDDPSDEDLSKADALKEEDHKESLSIEDLFREELHKQGQKEELSRNDASMQTNQKEEVFAKETPKEEVRQKEPRVEYTLRANTGTERAPQKMEPKIEYRLREDPQNIPTENLRQEHFPQEIPSRNKVQEYVLKEVPCREYILQQGPRKEYPSAGKAMKQYKFIENYRKHASVQDPCKVPEDPCKEVSSTAKPTTEYKLQEVPCKENSTAKPIKIQEGSRKENSTAVPRKVYKLQESPRKDNCSTGIEYALQEDYCTENTTSAKLKKEQKPQEVPLKENSTAIPIKIQEVVALKENSTAILGKEHKAAESTLKDSPSTGKPSVENKLQEGPPKENAKLSKEFTVLEAPPTGNSSTAKSARDYKVQEGLPKDNSSTATPSLEANLREVPSKENSSTAMPTTEYKPPKGPPNENSTTAQPLNQYTLRDASAHENSITEDPFKEFKLQDPCKEPSSTDPCKETSSIDPCKEPSTTENPCKETCATEDPCKEICATEDPCKETCATEDPCKEHSTTEDPCKEHSTTEDPFKEFKLQDPCKEDTATEDPCKDFTATEEPCSNEYTLEKILTIENPCKDILKEEPPTGTDTKEENLPECITFEPPPRRKSSKGKGRKPKCRRKKHRKRKKKKMRKGSVKEEEKPPSPKTVIVPLPILDDYSCPTSIALPFRDRPLRNLKSGSSASALEIYYTSVIKCFIAKGNTRSDIRDFNGQFYCWLTSRVLPLLGQEQWYPGFGGVLRILETIKHFGADDTYKGGECHDYGFLFDEGAEFSVDSSFGNKEASYKARDVCDIVKGANPLKRPMFAFILVFALVVLLLLCGCLFYWQAPTRRPPMPEEEQQAMAMNSQEIPQCGIVQQYDAQPVDVNQYGMKEPCFQEDAPAYDPNMQANQGGEIWSFGDTRGYQRQQEAHFLTKHTKFPAEPRLLHNVHTLWKKPSNQMNRFWTSDETKCYKTEMRPTTCNCTGSCNCTILTDSSVMTKVKTRKSSTVTFFEGDDDEVNPRQNTSTRSSTQYSTTESGSEDYSSSEYSGSSKSLRKHRNSTHYP